MNKNTSVIKAMLKPLYIEFDNGEVYVIDGHFVADDAAKFYAGKDPEHPEVTYKEEYKVQYEWLIGNTEELIYYIQELMKWEDLNAIYVGKKPYDYNEELAWCNVSEDVNIGELSY